MADSNVPEPGELRLLLNPRRSAHATIRGYLYQTCLGALRWLDLRPSEILLCEGEEDLDRFLLGGGAVSEQVKAYSGGLSLSDRAVVESLRNFLRSYVALRRRGETRRFVFTTTAYEKKKRIGGLNFDLLEAWKAGKRTPEVLAAVRSLLEPREDDKNRAETVDALSWLDAKSKGWKAFMNAVQWSFGAPDLSLVSYQIKNRLAAREDTRALPIETFRERLIAHVLRTSSLPKPEDRALTSRSLSDLIEEARTDLGNWVKTPAAERLRTLFDEFEKIRPLLHPNTAEVPDKASPGKLLTAAYEVIPFDETGRREELDFLTAWCSSDDRQSVLLLTGEGGSGKTRLMIEWCRHLRNQDWHAGFLKRDRKAEDLDPLLEGSIPRLVVIDYAETRLAVVEPFLLKMGLQSEGEGPRLRLVLVARRRGDWWKNLSRAGREVEDLLLRSPQPRTITPLIPQSTEEREKAFRAALDGFSFQLEYPISKDLHVPDLSRNEFERVLYLHMAALAALQGERIETATDALKQTLRHERQFWYETVSHQGLGAGLTRIFQDALEPAGAALTLIGGAKDLSDTISLWGRVLKVDLSPQNLMILTLVFRNLYGAPPGDEHRMISPLQPDLLGEELVAEALSRDEGLLGRVLDGATLEEAYTTLTSLTRIAQRRSEAEAWLRNTLGKKLTDLYEIALNIAIETGDPIGILLAKELQKPDNIDVAISIQKLCDTEKYAHSVPLTEVAAVATERHLALLRTPQPHNDEARLSQYIELASNLSIRLGNLGRHEAAFNFANEAVAICRQLAERSMGPTLPNLALSLTNLGVALSTLGRIEDAVIATSEAVSIRRQLARHSPDTYLPELAGALNNLSSMLNDLERQEEALKIAQEAVSIHRQLYQKDKIHSRNLAKSLHNLGNTLGRLGRKEEAVPLAFESVELHQQLARRRPDSSLPDFGTSLINLGILLSDIGRHEDSLDIHNKAINIFRRLSKNRPDIFLYHLAVGLNALGASLMKIGRHEDALQALSESVEIYRELAQTKPDALLQDLASGLNNLGLALSQLGRHEEAANAFEKSIEINRDFVQIRPRIIRPNLASSLVILGETQIILARFDDACQTTKEAIAIYRDLARKNPNNFLPELARSLYNLSSSLYRLGHRQEALIPILETIDLHQELAERWPDRFLPFLSLCFHDLSTILMDLGRSNDALRASEEAVRTLSPYFLHSPLQVGEVMQTVLFQYISQAAHTGRQPDEELVKPLRETLNEFFQLPHEPYRP